MQVAACELLHSLVIYMVGKGAQMTEDNKSAPPMYNLHRRVFPVLLRLACDVDQVFHPNIFYVMGIVEKKILSSFIHLHIVLNLYVTLSSLEHERRYFQKGLRCIISIQNIIFIFYFFA